MDQPPLSAAMPLPPPVDLDTLNAFIGHNPTMETRFLALFLATASATLEELESAKQAGNHDDIGKLSHRLKSSANTVGARAVAEICLQLENACRRGDLAQSHHLLAQLSAHFQEVRNFIEMHLRQPA